MSEAQKRIKKNRLIAGCGMLTAAAAILQYIEISIPIIPSFIKLDFSDLPALLGAFAYGPVAGILIELLKNIIHMPASGSQFIGELSNFVLGAAFAGAFVGGLVGSLVMAAVCVPFNYLVVYPLYYSVLGFPEEAVLGMYQAILPTIKSIFEALLVFNLPFTFVKGLISVAVSMLIYKPLSPLLKGKNI